MHNTLTRLVVTGACSGLNRCDAACPGVGVVLLRLSARTSHPRSHSHHEGWKNAETALRRGHRCRNGRPQPRCGLPDGQYGFRARGFPRSGSPRSPTPTPSSAEDGARRYGYEKALPSWEAVVEDPSIDAVSIVVGNALHRPIAEALVAAGKHVLCEKPLAGSIEDARAMVELERTADGGHRRRLHLPPVPRHRGDPRPCPQRRTGRDDPVQRPLLVRLRLRPRRPTELALQGGPGSGALGRHRRARHRRRGVHLRADRVGVRRRAVDPDPQAAAAAGRCGRARRRPGQQRGGRGRERGHGDVLRPLRLRAGGVVLGVAHRVRHAQRAGLRRLRAGRSGRLRLAPAGRVPVR